MPEDHRDRHQPASKTSILAQLKSLAAKSRHHVQPSGNEASDTLDAVETFIIDKPTSISAAPELSARKAALAAAKKNPNAAATFILDQPTSLTPEPQPPAPPVRTTDKTAKPDATNPGNAAIATPAPRTSPPPKPPIQGTQKPQISSSYTHSPKTDRSVVHPTQKRRPTEPPQVQNAASHPPKQKSIPTKQLDDWDLDSHPLAEQDVTMIFPYKKEVSIKPQLGLGQSIYGLVAYPIKGILRLLRRS